LSDLCELKTIVVECEVLRLRDSLPEQEIRFRGVEVRVFFNG
jgi:hypothetical protein